MATPNCIKCGYAFFEVGFLLVTDREYGTTGGEKALVVKVLFCGQCGSIISVLGTEPTQE